MQYKRTLATLASAGAVTAGMMVAPTAANAAPSEGSWSQGAAPATCFISAVKPSIIGGVGNTAKGVGKVYCQGGTVRVRLVVQLQKRINGVWRNQGTATACVGFVGGATKTCTDTNGATVGYWRTRNTGTIVSNGDTHTVYSGITQFVPARQGLVK